MTRPNPPSRPCRRSISRIMSLALTQGGSSPLSLTPKTAGMRRYTGSPINASATSMPPAPKANIPREPAADVWLSEPTSVSPGLPKRCICTGWLMPLPGRLYQIPKRRHAERRNRCSSAFRLSLSSRLWSMYWAATPTFTRSVPIASSSNITSVPRTSWRSAWSMRRAISSPGVMFPAFSRERIKVCVTLSGMVDLTCSVFGESCQARLRQDSPSGSGICGQAGFGQQIGVLLFEVPDLLEADHLDEVVEGVQRRLHRLVLRERRIDARQRVRSGKQPGGGIDRHGVTHLLQLSLRQDRGAAAVELVRQQRHVERRPDLSHLLFRLRGLDENDVGAGLRVGFTTPQCLVEAKRRSCVGSSKDKEVLRRARVAGDLDLVHHFVGRDHMAVRGVAALLRKYLVFDLDHRRAGFLIATHGVIHIQEAAIPRIAIGYQRLANRLHDCLHAVPHLGIW